MNNERVKLAFYKFYGIYADCYSCHQSLVRVSVRDGTITVTYYGLSFKDVYSAIPDTGPLSPTHTNFVDGYRFVNQQTTDPECPPDEQIRSG